MDNFTNKVLGSAIFSKVEVTVPRLNGDRDTDGSLREDPVATAKGRISPYLTPSFLPLFAFPIFRVAAVNRSDLIIHLEASHKQISR